MYRTAPYPNSPRVLSLRQNLPHRCLPFTTHCYASDGNLPLSVVTRFVSVSQSAFPFLLSPLFRLPIRECSIFDDPPCPSLEGPRSTPPFPYLLISIFEVTSFRVFRPGESFLILCLVYPSSQLGVQRRRIVHWGVILGRTWPTITRVRTSPAYF